MNHQLNVRVIDAIMGSGKTTYIIKQLNNEKDLNKRFLIVTPYLKEIDRLNEEIPRLCLKSPKEDDLEADVVKLFSTIQLRGFLKF